LCSEEPMHESLAFLEVRHADVRLGFLQGEIWILVTEWTNQHVGTILGIGDWSVVDGKLKQNGEGLWSDRASSLPGHGML
jgi:hypothetical protein